MPYLSLRLRPFLALACWLLAAPLWAAGPWGTAQWMWDSPDAAGTDVDNEPRYFRFEFELAAPPAKAELAATADNQVEVLVNGEKLGATDDWHKPVQGDIAKLLTTGKNVVALVARNNGGSAGALVWGEVTLADKKVVSLNSGANWHVAREASEGWSKAGFDVGLWDAASVLGPTSMGPWGIAAAVSSAADGPAPPAKEKQDATLELADFKLPEGFKIELVAADPLVVNPVAMALDEKGRLYYSESHTYRWGPPGSPYPQPTNPIVMLKPLADGKGFERVVVAEGFDDPVMGLIVQGGKLWCTANNFLYVYDIDDAGHTSNRQTLLTDKEKAWNPFGMFVLEPGPDGQIYLSVGNHNIQISGPNNSVTSRGGAGIITRLKPDGTDLERLVQGLRVPYSFEYDPFGQLWVLSNGEGNPNRFVRVIEGVDYHCYSRNADAAWLTGSVPLAPPCFELPGGANTQLLHYYGAAFPADYQGSQFLVNWGRHGFPSSNHTVYRYVPDARGNIVEQQPWLTSTDPNFRPTHILLDRDGNMLVSDWYGRDDENDKTGRIWKVSYVGDKPIGKPTQLTDQQWADLPTAVAALGSADHLLREQAMQKLAARGNAAVAALSTEAGKAAQPLGAASALWTLTRIGTPEAQAALAAGTQNSDWRVRRLALRLLRRFGVPAADTAGQALAADTDPAVQLEAALARKNPADVRKGLSDALAAGAAADAHLRYEAAWHLARVADAETIPALLAASDADIRLAGLIAIDVALFENFESAPLARKALAAAVAAPGELDVSLLLKLVEMNRSAELIQPLQAFLATPKLTTETAVQAILLLRSLAPQGANNLGDQAAANLLTAMRTGRVPVKTVDDAQLLLQLLPIEGPTDFSLQKLGQFIFERNQGIAESAHTMVRGFGPKAARLAGPIWQRLLAPTGSGPDKLELMTTVSAIEPEPNLAQWSQLLKSPDPLVVREAVRAWRRFQGRADAIQLLTDQAPALLEKDKALAGDLAVVLAELKADPAATTLLALPQPERDKAVLAKAVLEHPAGGGPAVAQGRQVFVRAGCAKCHTSVGTDIKIGPPLAGIGRVQKPEYLVESVLEPSKVIKTGFETETVETDSGKVYSGLVREQGDELVITEADKVTKIPKAEIESRQVQKKSLMPEGLEAQLSQDELNQLVAWLVSLKTGGLGDPGKK